MTTTSVPPPAQQSELANDSRASGARGALAWSSFAFAVLQSICTFFAAANGLRLAIGVGSIVLSAGAGAMVRGFHADALRIPMVVFALLGSIINLAVLGQIRRLRNRGSAQWRQRPLSAHKRRMERTQFALAIVSLVLVAVEEALHLHFHGHL